MNVKVEYHSNREIDQGKAHAKRNGMQLCMQGNWAMRIGVSLRQKGLRIQFSLVQSAPGQDIVALLGLKYTTFEVVKNTTRGDWWFNACLNLGSLAAPSECVQPMKALGFHF